MTNDEPKPRRGLLPEFKPGPDWEEIIWAVWFAAVALTFCALLLTVSIGTLREWGLLWLGLPLVAVYALRIVAVGLWLTPLDEPTLLSRLARRVDAACKASTGPLWLGTLAAAAVLYLHGHSPATLGLEDGRATLLQGGLLGLGVGAAIPTAFLAFRAPRLAGRR